MIIKNRLTYTGAPYLYGRKGRVTAFIKNPDVRAIAISALFTSAAMALVAPQESVAAASLFKLGAKTVIGSSGAFFVFRFIAGCRTRHLFKDLPAHQPSKFASIEKTPKTAEQEKDEEQEVHSNFFSKYGKHEGVYHMSAGASFFLLSVVADVFSGGVVASACVKAAGMAAPTFLHGLRRYYIWDKVAKGKWRFAKTPEAIEKERQEKPKRKKLQEQIKESSLKGKKNSSPLP